MKKVKHNGVQYNVSDWVHYVTTDQDGEVYGFEIKPDTVEDTGEWVTPFGMIEQLVQHKVENWDTLITKV